MANRGKQARTGAPHLRTGPSAEPHAQIRSSQVRSRPESRLDDLVREICRSVGEFIEVWGFRSIHGRVWALLAIRSAPLSQTEIAEFLGVSRSLIHLAVSELEAYGLVRPVGEQRNAPCEARLDVWPTITEVLRSREWMLMERTRLALEAALAETEAAKRSGSDIGDLDPNRIRLLLLMTEFAQSTLRTILRIRMPMGLDDLGDWLRRASRTLRKFRNITRFGFGPG